MNPTPVPVQQFFEAPHDLTGWLGLVAFGILGLFAVLGWWDKKRKERTDLADKLDDKVIKLLKEQVEALEKKVEEQATVLKETADKLESLVNENRTLRDVLQGRDAQFLDFQEKGMISMGRVEKILELTSDTNINVGKLYKAIEHHLQIMENHTHDL
jgi:hypothetical protein